MSLISLAVFLLFTDNSLNIKKMILSSNLLLNTESGQYGIYLMYIIP